MSLLDKLRALLDAETADTDAEIDAEIDADEIDDAEEAVEAVETIDTDTPDDSRPDEIDGDGEGIDVADDPIDSTPGVEEESPEVADLRQTIIEQAATIESLRNLLAAAGLGDEIDDELADEIDDTEDEIEEDAVAAFDSDYAERQAILAALTEGN